jgi:1-deoxy-D-xylulose-5-phosphate reductoisomerase
MALKHPNWSRGAKITVDSATMMNKGLVIIEASWLFGIPARDIEVVVHPQSAIHSAVEFMDGSIVAQIGAPDMRLPIAYALSYPERVDEPGKRFSFTDLGAMTFEKPDPKTFKCLKLAYVAIEKGGSYPAVLNCANEEAVANFLSGRIRFVQIADCVEYALEQHNGCVIGSVDDILNVEQESRAVVREYINNLT